MNTELSADAVHNASRAVRDALDAKAAHDLQQNVARAIAAAQASGEFCARVSLKAFQSDSAAVRVVSTELIRLGFQVVVHERLDDHEMSITWHFTWHARHRD